MSWGVDVYLELRQQELIQPTERGAMPLPEDVAEAMESCADGVERHALAVADNVVTMAPAELRWLAAEIRDGTPAGRLAFRATLIDVIEIKRGNKPSGGVTRFLPVDVLAPFGAGDIHDDVRGEHARRYLDEIAETKELTDPSLRR
jgi:hypothetical protein